MTGGTVPVPPCRSCAYRDDVVLPVQVVSHFLGEREAAGVKPPREFSLELSISPEPKIW